MRPRVQAWLSWLIAVIGGWLGALSALLWLHASSFPPLAPPPGCP